jgi:hypothetical protein
LNQFLRCDTDADDSTPWVDEAADWLRRLRPSCCRSRRRALRIPPRPAKRPLPSRARNSSGGAETAYAEIRRISNLVGSDAALDELSGRLSRVEGEFADLSSAGPSAAMADPDYLQTELAERDAVIDRWADQLERRGEVLDAAVHRYGA